MSNYPLKASANQKIQGEQGTTPELLSWIAHYHKHPVLGSTISPHATVTLTTPVVLAADTVFAAQPDVPRNIILTGNAGADEAIIVNGLDASGAAIHEDFTLSGTTPQVGALAFKSFTSFVYPAGTHTCAFVCGSVLGLVHLLKYGIPLSKFSLGSSVDAGTLATSATVLASNTYTPAGALDGTKAVDLWYAVDA
jgi:hypothetical protein